MQRHYGDLILVLWLAWFAYWRIRAVGNKPTARRETAWSRAAHIAPMLLAGALLFVRTEPHGGWLFHRIWPRSAPIDRLGVALVAAGLALCVWARLYLGRNWSGTVTVKQDHELVRTGPYARVRHPIYSGLLLALIGTALWRGQWRGVLAVAIACAALWYKLRLEERWMRQSFGDAYEQYRRSSYALIPFLL